MGAAVAVRRQLFEFGGILGVVAISDPVDETLAHLESAMRARDGVCEDLYTLGVVIGSILRERLLCSLGCFVLGYGAAPGDIACVPSLHIGEKYLADCGAGSIGCYDKVCG